MLFFSCETGIAGQSAPPLPMNPNPGGYTIEGMGHTWAGGKSMLPAFMVGKTSDKIKANDIIWEFFLKHPQ